MRWSLKDGNIYHGDKKNYLLVGASDADIMVDFEDAIRIKQVEEGNYLISYYVIELDDNLTYKKNIQTKEFIHVPYPFFLSKDLYKRLPLSNYKVDLLKRKMLDVPDFISVSEYRKKYDKEVNGYLKQSIKNLEKIPIGQIFVANNNSYIYYGIDLQRGTLSLKSVGSGFYSIEYETVIETFKKVNDIIPRNTLRQDAILDNIRELKKMVC